MGPVPLLLLLFCPEDDINFFCYSNRRGLEAPPDTVHTNDKVYSHVVFCASLTHQKRLCGAVDSESL